MKNTKVESIGMLWQFWEPYLVTGQDGQHITESLPELVDWALSSIRREDGGLTLRLSAGMDKVRLVAETQFDPEQLASIVYRQNVAAALMAIMFFKFASQSIDNVL